MAIVAVVLAAMLRQPSVSDAPREIHRLRLVRARVAWPQPPQNAWLAVTRPAATGAAAWAARQSLLQFAVGPAVAGVAQACHRFRDNVPFPACAYPDPPHPPSHPPIPPPPRPT